MYMNPTFTCMNKVLYPLINTELRQDEIAELRKAINFDLELIYYPDTYEHEYYSRIGKMFLTLKYDCPKDNPSYDYEFYSHYCSLAESFEEIEILLCLYESLPNYRENEIYKLFMSYREAVKDILIDRIWESGNLDEKELRQLFEDK